MARPGDDELRAQLAGIGIVIASDQDRIIDIAKRCSMTGVIFGTSWALLGTPALAAGQLAGFLSGFLAGTVVCTSLSQTAQEQLRNLPRTIDTNDIHR